MPQPWLPGRGGGLSPRVWHGELERSDIVCAAEPRADRAASPDCRSTCGQPFHGSCRGARHAERTPRPGRLSPPDPGVVDGGGRECRGQDRAAAAEIRRHARSCACGRSARSTRAHGKACSIMRCASRLVRRILKRCAYMLRTFCSIATVSVMTVPGAPRSVRSGVSAGSRQLRASSISRRRSGSLIRSGAITSSFSASCTSMDMN